MPRTSKSTVEHVIGVTMDEAMENKVRFVLSTESEAMQDEIAKLAKADQVSDVEYYANVLFSRAFEAKLNYAQSKIDKIADNVFNLYRANGYSEEQAREFADKLRVK